MIIQGLDLAPSPSTTSGGAGSSGGGGSSSRGGKNSGSGGIRGGSGGGFDSGLAQGQGLALAQGPAFVPHPNELLQLPGVSEEMVKRMRSKHRVTGLRDLVLMAKGR